MGGNSDLVEVSLTREGYISGGCSGDGTVLMKISHGVPVLCHGVQISVVILMQELFSNFLFVRQVRNGLGIGGNSRIMVIFHLQ